jgi:uncharacterized membrane protein YccC
MSDWNSLSPAEKIAFWSESERLLRDLLAACLPYLKSEQKATASELIDHNEHQLALEFLFDYLDEEPARYPAALVEKFRVLDQRLHLTGRRDLAKLGR